IIPNFHPPLADKVRAGVKNSLKQILEKRVVQSLEPLFDNNRMDIELRKLIRETFPEFCSNSGPVESKPEDFVSGVSSSSVTKMDLMAETGLDFAGGGLNSENDVNNSNHFSGGGGGGVSGDDDAMFSDEEEEQQQPLPTSNKGPPPVPKVPPAFKGPPKKSDKVVSPVIKDETPVIKHVIEKEIKEDLTGVVPEVLDVKLLVKNEVNNVDEKIDLHKHLEYLEPDMKTILLDYQEEKDTKRR
ncbi:unnamed protein product, partial [Meganyctiphanes norvegica]